MKKVAIVGVEGSGKTVMLAGLGDLYSHVDDCGYFLSPKNFGTAAYVADKIARMRKGEWPVATAGDEMQGLDWTLRRRKRGLKSRPEDICEVSFLDFAGEVYRAAFGIGGGGASIGLRAESERLKAYVREADDLIVLINLRDVITNGLRDKRVQEAMWITKAILDTALGDAGRDAPRAAIVLSQADSYAATIEACGGAAGVLQKYLPYVANDYNWLDIFAANAVDKTVMDDDGNMVPAPDFQSEGLRPVVRWVLDGLCADDDEPHEDEDGDEEEDDGLDVADPQPAASAPVNTKRVNGFVFVLTVLSAAIATAVCLFSEHWGVGSFFGLVLFGLFSERDNKKTKQTAGPWLGCAVVLLLSGLFGCAGHWIIALVGGVMAIGIIQK